MVEVCVWWMQAEGQRSRGEKLAFFLVFINICETIFERGTQ
jgi:hypothetical protein